MSRDRCFSSNRVESHAIAVPDDRRLSYLFKGAPPDYLSACKQLFAEYLKLAEATIHRNVDHRDRKAEYQQRNTQNFIRSISYRPSPKQEQHRQNGKRDQSRATFRKIYKISTGKQSQCDEERCVFLIYGKKLEAACRIEGEGEQKHTDDVRIYAVSQKIVKLREGVLSCNIR